jgi:hypothetical protein
MTDHSSDREKTVAIPFSELVDPDVVTRGNGPASRLDPYWTMLWPNSNGGPAISWRSLRADETIRESGMNIKTRYDKGRHVDEARALLNKRPSRIAALATINLWRTITGPQLAAMRGQPVLSSPHLPRKGNDLAILYDAGLVQSAYGPCNWGGSAQHRQFACRSDRTACSESRAERDPLGRVRS